MKKIIIAAVVFCSFSSLAQTKREALLIVDSMHLFQKYLKQNETYEYVFELKNTGDTTAFIEEVHSTCGGVTPAISSRFIRPGESCRISCNYQTGDGSGSFNKTINVLTENRILCKYEKTNQTGKWHDGRTYFYFLVKGDVVQK